MRILPLLSILILGLLAATPLHASTQVSGLDADWLQPPKEARLRAYWWWLNGNVTKDAITRDLVEMKSKGFGGALLCDAGGADQRGNDRVPAGPAFMSAAWRELYRHALSEAARLDLEISLTIQSGWNLGGPMIKPQDSVKALVWSETLVKGPSQATITAQKPHTKTSYYEDLFVIACKRRPLSAGPKKPLSNLRVKTLEEKIKFTGPDAWFRANSAPDTSAVWQEDDALPGEADSPSSEVVDLSGRMNANGVLHWAPPPGDWIVLRFGCTLADSHDVSTASDGWKGLALDPFDPSVLRSYWEGVVAPLIADAGPLAGKTLRYLHTDSWEIDLFNWTRALRQEFRTRRGYDMLPYLPVFAGLIIGDRQLSTRFLNDYRKTLGDLAVDCHYRLLSEWAGAHGIGIHPEAGGPHFTPIDSQRCLGVTDVPMAEFWAESQTHRTSDATRFFVKQPASAAHTYGKRIVAAEAFTTVGPHWEERLWNNLKPSFDHAACEGLNRVVWHAFVCSPSEMGIPGQQYFAGTHLNPNVTWWDKSGPFFDYLNRCQAMLQRGLFVADVLYYYGDHVPNFAQSRASDPAHVGPGYDYDVLTEEALLTRLSVREGRILLPDGMNYRMLVLPPIPGISLPVLRRIRELVKAGATVVGPRPKHNSGLTGFAETDNELQVLVRELWGDGTLPGPIKEAANASEVLSAGGVSPDFASEPRHDGKLGYVHRRDGETEIYFLANREKKPISLKAWFRVSGKEPELWDPVTGSRGKASAWTKEGDRTIIPLDLPACGSLFVVFRQPTPAAGGTATANTPEVQELQSIDGPWELSLDPNWGGPKLLQLDRLASWTLRPESGVKFYSGTGTYRCSFIWNMDVKDTEAKRFVVDLGDVRELASVRLNGRSLGTVWAPPFRVDVSKALKDGENLLEIEVVNFWPNRIIGDQVLASGKPYTRTNIRRLTKDSRLMESGLLGPVKLLAVEPLR